jgi:hypothetical protein
MLNTLHPLVPLNVSQSFELQMHQKIPHKFHTSNPINTPQPEMYESKHLIDMQRLALGSNQPKTEEGRAHNSAERTGENGFTTSLRQGLVWGDNQTKFSCRRRQELGYTYKLGMLSFSAVRFLFLLHPTTPSSSTPPSSTLAPSHSEQQRTPIPIRTIVIVST